MQTRAAAALGRESDPRAAAVLLTALQERNLAAVAGAYAFFIGRGEPGSQDVIIEALVKLGQSDMATYLLNCGDSGLEAAARSWGIQHGYKITTTPGASAATWGSAQR
jgi:HEAT repeat protein